MYTALLIAGILAALYGLHRLALWMEAKGWIYYVKKRASPDTIGSAVLELQQMVKPATKHVLEVRRQRRVENPGAGDPPEAGRI